MAEHVGQYIAIICVAVWLNTLASVTIQQDIYAGSDIVGGLIQP
jgi:hypothetical protein